MSIAILGTGVMGKRIALIFIENGHNVVLWDHVCRDNILKELKRDARLWRLDFKKISGLIELTSDLRKIHECQLVIETVCEDENIKSNLLKQVSSIVPADTRIASNTSSLSIENLSLSVTHPERFHGLHFFNPPQKVKFAEISRCSKTSDDTIAFAGEILQKMGISFIDIPDIPGFVANYILFSAISSSILLKQTHGINSRDIDKAMKFGALHPMGPLELADFIGLDISLIILNSLYSRTGDKRFEPPALLETLVANNHMGRKSGKGFYEYG